MEQLTQAQIQAILASPEAAKLRKLLQTNCSDAILQQAAQAAKDGNLQQVQNLLGQTLNPSEVHRLTTAYRNAHA